MRYTGTMQVRSPELFKKLEALAGHYNRHVASPQIKGEFSSLNLSRRDWDEIELITVRQELYRHQGYHLDELYLKMLSLARFVKQARTHWGGGIKGLISQRYASRPSSERLMAEMVAANFPANLSVLGDLVFEVYQMAKQEDAEQNQGKTRALASVPEAAEIDTLLGKK